MSETHVMVDIESMGGGSITQIGAVAFDVESGSIGAEFSTHVDLCGQATDPATVKWWMEQDGAARVAWVDGQRGAPSLASALEAFAAWLKPLKAEGIWSHGATYDLPILHAACAATGKKTRWHYRDARDTRTLVWLCRPFDPWVEDAPADEVKHDALADARRQARMVCRAVAHLRRPAHPANGGTPTPPDGASPEEGKPEGRCGFVVDPPPDVDARRARPCRNPLPCAEHPKAEE